MALFRIIDTVCTLLGTTMVIAADDRRHEDGALVHRNLPDHDDVVTDMPEGRSTVMY